MSIIAPSILSADWTRLGEEIKAVENAGADWIHLDVMDGQFVPPITFGPQLVGAARGVTKLPFDVHLMIIDVDKQIKPFAEAGANIITIHHEAGEDTEASIERIHKRGIKAGLSIKPDTSVDNVQHLIEKIDLLLIMTVEPGWGGQAFIPESIDKISQSRALIDQIKPGVQLEVDGGINKETARLAREAGADVFVAGSYIFKSKNYREAISTLR